MKRYFALIFLVLSFFTFSCGGDGGSSEEITSQTTTGTADNTSSDETSQPSEPTYQVSGVINASRVKGLRVCDEITRNCALTDSSGSFVLQAGVPLPEIELFIPSTDGVDVKLADYQMVENGEVITPYKIMGSVELGDVLGRVIHALNGDTTNEMEEIDLSSVTVESNLSDSIENLIKSEQSFSLSFIYSGNSYSLDYEPSLNKVQICDSQDCEDVNYRNWLVLIYMDADDYLLTEYYMQDILELQQATYNPLVKVVVMADSYGDNGGEIFESDGLSGELTKTKDIPEPNMGDPQTIVSFVETYTRKYPAANIALILWDHGDGWKSYSTLNNVKVAAWDEYDNDYLFMYELQSAFEMLKENGIKLSLIGFDACLMGMVEVLYDVKDYADVFVLSEYFEPARGWNYANPMGYMVQNPKISPYELGKQFVDAYPIPYSSLNQDITLAVVSKEEAEGIIDLVNQLAEQLSSSNVSDYESARTVSYELPGEQDHIDLYSFVDNLQTSVAEQLKNVLEGIYYYSSNPSLHGLAIYFPMYSNNPYLDIYCTDRNNPATLYDANGYVVAEGYFNPFTDELWDDMLLEYYKLTGN